MENRYFRRLRRLRLRGIQPTIMIAFSVISISTMFMVGAMLYIRFATLTREKTIESTERMMEQASEDLEDYLGSMRRISDTAYYNIIKERDFAAPGEDIQREINILYEANRDSLRSIAVYNDRGSLIAAEPIASQKERSNVTVQDWYKQAVGEMENMHFSTPHIQNLFDDATFRYYWVISLSRTVELTESGDPRLGVLLVDMDYASVSRMMQQINTAGNGQYYYLCDSEGEIIYHPRQAQMNDGIGSENSIETAGYGEGVYDEDFGGERRKVIVNTISYTGWKLVGVIPYSTFTRGMIDLRYFIVMLMLLMAMMLVIVNRVISARISSPILKLNDSVMEYEAGKKPDIYVGGSPEISRLGLSIQSSYEQIDMLMRKIVLEQNERRKSELDALQGQINPHFLYNALESITWMVEGERNDDAAFMLSQLAKFFRISLSKGHTVISVGDELQHARSYMNIQKVRYKNAFSIAFDIEESLSSYSTVKLVLQPILENAVNYGIGGIDDDGEIKVKGRLKEGDVILSVQDNGLGMSEEEVSLILTDSNRIRKRGSGVGLVNVNNRIQLVFGKEYGLIVESEPDVGTTVSIRIPAIPYNEENRKTLEKGHVFGEEEIRDGKE